MLEIVQEIGAAAGLAAGVGLAMLSALHFSQAREVKRLREWAGRAPVTTPPRRSKPVSSRIGTRSIVVALVGLLVVGGVVAQLIGDDGGQDSGSARANHDSRLPNRPKRTVAAVKPGNVTVAVLNGTTVPGLAAALRDRITAAGFKGGTINNFSEQQIAESVVQYTPGHEEEAKAVSRRFAISRREPVTADSRALAPDATVIVIAGTDKAP